ncbi:MAG TPA: hypothetical protein VFY13_06785, partial [Luteolibacter sp.]|nr:hypothetical protein [Luteolibacter sp.]
MHRPQKSRGRGVRLLTLIVCLAGHASAEDGAPYAGVLDALRAELTAQLPKIDDAQRKAIGAAKDTKARIELIRKMPELEKCLTSD